MNAESHELNQNDPNDLQNQLAGGEVEFGVETKKPDKQKTLLLIAVAVIGAGVLYYMYGRKGPETAAAAVTTQQDITGQKIDQFLVNGNRDLQQMELRLRDAEKVVKQFLTDATALQVPLSELKTNPFRLSTINAEKAPITNEEEKQRLEQERLAALKAFGELNLQSIMHSGTRKACMINNSLYQEGQSVGEFLIEKITPTGVAVKTGAYRFVLRMQR